MDNSGNGFNKLVVLLAVGVLGIAAGQYLFKPGTPVAQHGPWSHADQYQQVPGGYLPPGYAPTGYGPQPAYGPPAQLHASQPASGFGQMPQLGTGSSSALRREAGNSFPPNHSGPPAVLPVQHTLSPLDVAPNAASTESATGGDSLIDTRIAAVPSPLVLAPALATVVPPQLEVPRIIGVDDGVRWTGTLLSDVLLKGSSVKVEARITSSIEIPNEMTLVAQVDNGPPIVFHKFAVKAIKKEIRDVLDLPSIGLNATAGRHTLKIGFWDSNDPPDTINNVKYSAPIIVRVPAGGTPPSSIKTASSRGGTLTDQNTTARDVYDGHLHVEGVAAPDARIRFLFAKSVPSKPAEVTHPGIGVTNADGQGKWATDLTVPGLGLADPDGQVFVYTESLDQHTFAALPILVRRGTRSPAPKIELASVQQGDPVGAIEKKWFARDPKLTITIKTEGDVPNGVLALMAVGSSIPLATATYSAGTPTLKWTAEDDGKHVLRVDVVQGAASLVAMAPFTVSLRQRGPYPTGVSPTNLSQSPGKNAIRVAFNAENLLNFTTIAGADFKLVNQSDEKKYLNADTVNPSVTDNSVDLIFPPIPEGAYRFEIGATANDIQDLHGNGLATGSDGKLITFGVLKPVGSDIASMPTAGLSNLTGPNVPYPEFTPPRKSTTGFNPSDKVVTRVARLYYYRDAHRVVQLIKRDAARSYNRQAVDMQQQLADNARRDAENATDSRKASEQLAIRAAQRARTAETALNQFQQGLVTARQQRDAAEGQVTSQSDKHVRAQQSLEDAVQAKQTAADSVANPALTAAQLESLELTPEPLRDQQRAKLLEANKRASAEALTQARKTETAAMREVNASQRTVTKAQADQTAAAAQVATMEQHVNALLGEVQTARNEEAQQRDSMDRLQLQEDRKHADLFRREVAAAHEDPDTYAPGKPDSDDPIEQVSLSVIGEGLIQLRGPLKGVNLARTLINQIDAPVGQVKVAIHTVQVNGENGKRMEPVVGRIQRYIDHSRFLTTQSSQMLRNAVTLVASRRANQALVGCDALTQTDRDQKYIESFFGREFLAELRTLDSEFLHTGNKLLSLHSMDSTSLANALFLLSLAKNDVRQEILATFEQMVAGQLPQDEQDYFTASTEKYKFGPPFHKTKFEFLGHNAKFVSLKGFFNAEVAGPETLTPMQREFIRLAQIFKSRLVTEIELQQRVMERALIEDRFTDVVAELTRAADQERVAKDRLRNAQSRLADHQQSVLVVAQQIKAHTDILVVHGSKSAELARFSEQLVQQLSSYLQASKMEAPTGQLSVQQQSYDFSAGRFAPESRIALHAFLDEGRKWAEKNAQLYARVNFLGSNETRRIGREKRFAEFSGLEAHPANLVDAFTSLQAIAEVLEKDVKLLAHLRDEAQRISSLMQAIVDEVYKPTPDSQRYYPKWVIAKNLILVYAKGEFAVIAERLVPQTDAALDAMMTTQANIAIAERLAETSRRPLDHKKFLDMLIDDVEDKFIELMEGTRAHTANIDNYLSRLGQALEDDFNTQFYFPAFRGIREASRYWDVNMGQIETTTILTNNRTFAKVSPQATMEFDLPKRDILIQEAFQAAEAAYSDYGALLGDPTFLSLVKMHRGQPPSAQFGSGNSTPTMRNVLPGLPASTDERLVAQNRAVAPDFPSALESLIPDPAIYKFETGTGFEIRPVIQPDGQAVVFHFNYMYTTNVREPVRADEKHLGRVKRHFIDTDVQIGNYEMREVSKYQVALKASRTSRGVPLLEDIPGAGVLFRPLPSQESSLQENIILAQTAIFPTLFDLMGLRWAPAVADLDSLRLHEADFVVRGRQRALRERVFDYSSQQVDDFMRIPASERRSDLYRAQETIPSVHPNGYSGPGLNQIDGVLRETYSPDSIRPESRFIPGTDAEGASPRGGPAMKGFWRDLPCPAPNPADRGPVLQGNPSEPSPQPVFPPAPAPASAPNRRSQFVPTGRTTQPEAGSQLELQSYQTEAKPAVRTAPPPSAPRASRPVSKSPGSTPGLLPPVSQTPERLPTPSNRTLPAGPAGMSTSQHGFSSPVQTPTASRPVPASPVHDTSAGGERRPSGVVQVNANEPAKVVQPEPVTPKKKFGLPSVWSKKP